VTDDNETNRAPRPGFTPPTGPADPFRNLPERLRPPGDDHLRHTPRLFQDPELFPAAQRSPSLGDHDGDLEETYEVCDDDPALVLSIVKGGRPQTALIVEQDGTFRFCPNGYSEAVRVSPDGTFLVNGEEVTCDSDLYAGFARMFKGLYDGGTPVRLITEEEAE
jgi:hypothetical protein